MPHRVVVDERHGEHVADLPADDRTGDRPAERPHGLAHARRDLQDLLDGVQLDAVPGRAGRNQFAAEHSGRFTWDYLESGPEVWRVRIGRA
ncbi:hypothetical protein GCM10010182_17060 [Actinomadura cremea]|nr:hypothetical protein GCM10010182_17060 [Actinomadura cremea]